MRRTPPWVFVAAAGIELAVLLLCVWGMEHSRIADAEQAPEALPPRAEPEAAEPSAPPGLPPVPMFGPPPERPEAPRVVSIIPAFIVEPADAGAQLVGGTAGEGQLAFGFYADGNMRFVDADGGRYAGKADSARARMREVDGTRAFTVQIGVGEDQRLQAAFTGGEHDGETIALEPLVGWSVV